MKKELAEALINKGIMKPGTLLYGITETSGLGQTIQSVPLELMMEDFNGKIFYCRDRLGKKYIMDLNKVQEVDGMTPVRLASVFNIKPNGQNATIGKKRGRKPKMKCAQLTNINTAEGESYGESKRTEGNYHT
jgi:hypothetical protein